jgi:hypothetical protein
MAIPSCRGHDATCILQLIGVNPFLRVNPCTLGIIRAIRVALAVADFEMDFQTMRSPAYEFVPADVIYKAFPNARRDDGPFGYRYGGIIARGKPKLVRPDASAFDLAVGTLLRLGKIPETKHEALAEALKIEIPKLARSLGMILGRGPRIGDDIVETLSDWYYWADCLRRMFDFKNPSQPGTVLHVDLNYRSDRPPTLVIKPPKLAAAIMFHAMRSIAAGTALQSCAQCRTPFMSGGGRGRGRKKAGAHFCSDRCRWTYYNENKR